MDAIIQASASDKQLHTWMTELFALVSGPYHHAVCVEVELKGIKRIVGGNEAIAQQEVAAVMTAIAEEQRLSWIHL